MSTTIPQILPWGLPTVRNSSIVRGLEPQAIDQAQTWIACARRLQHPMSWNPTPADATLARYREIYIPPGTTHIDVRACYTGDGISFDMELPAAAGFQTVSALPPVPVGVGGSSIYTAKWMHTTWAATVDAPAGGLGHLDLAEHAAYAPDTWQRATIRMQPLLAALVYAWTTYPVCLAGTATP